MMRPKSIIKSIDFCNWKFTYLHLHLFPVNDTFFPTTLQQFINLLVLNSGVKATKDFLESLYIKFLIGSAGFFFKWAQNPSPKAITGGFVCRVSCCCCCSF